MDKRVEFEMTEEQHKGLMKMCQPVPYLLGSGGMPPRSPQENANSAWQSLGNKLGFKHMTVKPVAGKSDRFFTAEAVDTEEGESNEPE